MSHELQTIEASTDIPETDAKMPYEYVLKYATDNDIVLPFDERSYDTMSDDDFAEEMRILMEETVNTDNSEEKDVVSAKEEVGENKENTNDDPADLKRRQFLKGSAAAGSLVALGGLSSLIDNIPEEQRDDSTSAKLLDEQKTSTADLPNTKTTTQKSEVSKQEIEVEKNNAEPIAEQEANIEQEDERITGEKFMEQVRENSDGHINVEKAKRAIYEKYYQLYAPGGAYHERMMRGIENGSQWISEIKTHAEEAGLTIETMMAIAVGESYYENLAASYTTKNGKKEILARGPFQIIESTAKRSMKRLGVPLRIEQNYDERCDYVKAGRSAAKLLEFNYDYFKEDLSIAKTGYNGWSKARDFKKMCIKENVACTYDSYNQWLETQINKEIDTIHERYTRTYTVGEGDTIAKISHALQISEKTLRSYNNIPPNDNMILVGDVFNLPMDQKAFEKAVEIMFNKKWKQNFVYPEKINAIEQMLTDKKILETLPRNEIPYEEYPVPRSEVLQISHIIKDGDTLSSIVDSIKQQYTAQTDNTIASRILLVNLRKNNPNTIGSDDTIRIGDSFQINLPQKKSPSLVQVAQKTNSPVALLHKLNPSVLKTDTPLPEDIALRIPKNDKA